MILGNMPSYAENLHPLYCSTTMLMIDNISLMDGLFKQYPCSGLIITLTRDRA